MSQPMYIDDYTRPVDLNPRTTALLIIDMQYASGSRHHGLGKLLAAQNKLVAIVSDATGTCSDEMQEAYLKTWRRLWGRVASTDEVIAEIRGSDAQRRTG